MRTVVREAEEEIGVTLNPKNLVQIFVKEAPDYKATFFAASIDRNAKINLDDESDGYGWFALSNLPDGMLDSKEDVLKWRDLARKGLANL